MKKCASSDICERFKDGRCKIISLARVNVVGCSQRELTSEGKRLIKKGERK